MTKQGSSLLWRRLVTGTVMLVGVYDVVIGAYLLASETPWLAHGPGTTWIALGEALGVVVPPDPTLGLFRRMGAFSLHAGVCTLVWAGLGHRQPALQTALFLTYLTTGMGFAFTDNAFFPDTPYLTAKNVIGAFFTAALLVHFWQRRREKAASHGA